MTMQDLIGCVYKNWATGNKWQIIEVSKKDGHTLITLRDETGCEFNTTPELMINYSFTGYHF